MPAPYEKAVEKTADAIGKVADAATGLGKFTASVFGGTIQELAGWSQDVVKSKRLHWQISNVQRTMEKLAALKAIEGQLRPLPARQASVLLDAIANEDDDELQRLWARLLNAAIDPRGTYEIKRVHMNVLRSIDPIEARIISAVGDFLRGRKQEERVFFGKDLAVKVGAPEEMLTVYLHHLASLGCFIAGDKTVGFAAEASPEPAPTIDTQSADFQVTTLLTSLLEVI
jgi:hypothetical protein